MQTILTIIALGFAAVAGFAAGVVYGLEHAWPELKAQRWANLKAGFESLFKGNKPN